jgi:hypothetical protein
MEAAGVEFSWVPAQDFPKQTIDLRALAERTARGYKVGTSSTANTTKTQPAVKRKRAEAEEAGNDEMDATCDVNQVPDLKRMRGTCKRDVVGVNANRVWKVPVASRSSASHRQSVKSWDQKVRKPVQFFVPKHLRNCMLCVYMGNSCCCSNTVFSRCSECQFFRCVVMRSRDSN